MLEIVQKIFAALKSFWPLFMVLPWESAVRVRGGKRTALLPPGLHFRIPFFDVVALINTRLRFVPTEQQTLTTIDGQAFVVGAMVGFRIVDPLLATQRHHQPERAVQAVAYSEIARAVAGAHSADVTPRSLADIVRQALKSQANGYEYDSVCITDFGRVPTFRVIQSHGCPGWAMIEERQV